MNQSDIDAIVNIVCDAIDTRIKSTRSELESSIGKAIAGIQTQAESLAEFRGQVKAFEPPKDGLDASPDMVSEAVAKHLAANPVIAPEPLTPTASQIGESVKAYIAANPMPEPLAPCPDMVSEAVQKFMAANPVKAPEAPAPLAPTDSQISEAVAKHFQSNPVIAPEPLAPTSDMISDAVAKYLAANPVPVPTAPEALEPTDAQLDAAVAKHFEGFEVNVPEPTPESIESAVQKYLTVNPIKLPDAPEALAPTQEQLAGAVEKHLASNPPATGSRGLDALEITILTAINQERRYAKGTYARWGGGVIRALRDTEPGEPMSTGCWDVVIDGVKSIEVHPLGGSEFAVKSILTGGASHITKMAAPTFDESYKDVWKESAGEYKRGDIVTHKGSVWLAKASTMERPGAGEGWKLIVKAGRDGKDISVVKLDRPATYKLGS